MKNRHVRRSVLFVLLAVLSALSLGTAAADEPLMTPAQPESLEPSLEQLPLWLAGGGQSCYGGPGTGCPSCRAICCYRCNGQSVWVPADVGSEFACKQACQADCGGGCSIL